MTKEKVLDRANLIFALFIICLPILISFFHLFGLIFVNYDLLLVIFLMIWIVCFSIYLTINFRKINFKNPIVILILILFSWIVISTIVNNAFNYNFVVYLSYFCIGITFYLTKNKLLIINTFISVITICCIMGFIDPYGQFMPGFNSEAYKFSLQFCNLNHIGYVVVLTELIISGLFIEKRNIFHAITFIIIAFYIFFNGSFAPITAIFLGLFIFFIYYWIKRKKFPVDVLLIILVFSFIAAIIEVFPVLSNFKFNEYGYFTECVAVFDNIFGTNLLQYLGIDEILGADGWERDSLMSQSFKYLGESFIFGKGCGFSEGFRPHNEFMFISLDFGLIAGILYFAIPIMILIKKFKYNPTLSIAIISYFFSGLFGNITSHSFIYFVMIVGMLSQEEKTLSN